MADARIVLSARDETKAAFASVKQSLSSLKGEAAGLQATMAGLAAGIGVGALVGFIKQAIDAGDETNKLAQKMGVATEEVAGLQLAYQQAGLDSQTMASSVGKLSKAVAENNIGLRALGITTREAGGGLRGTMAVLGDVADKFALMPDGVQKAALAIEIFGKSGAELIPLLNGGRQGLQQMAEMAEKLGLVIDSKTAKASEEFNDTLALLQKGSQGMWQQVAAQLLPTMQSLAASWLENKTKGDGLQRTADTIAAALKGVYSAGVIAVEVFNTMGKTWGGIIAAFVQAREGNFRGAWESLKAMASDLGDGWRRTADTVQRAWSDQGNAAVASATKTLGVGRDLLAEAKAREEAAKRAAAAEQKRFENIQQLVLRLQARELGVDVGFNQTLNDFDQFQKKLGLSADEVKRLKEAYIDLQPYMEKARKLAKEEGEARREAAEAMAKQRQEAEKATAQLAQSNDKLREEIEAMGLTEQQLVQLEVARNNDAIASKQQQLAGMGNTEFLSREAIALAEDIRLLRERNDLLGQKMAKGISVENAKAAAAEWKQLTDGIYNGLSDALYRGFEAGKGFFKSFWDGLKNTIKTTVLRVAVQAVMNGSGLAGMLGQTAGAAGALTGNASGGGIGGLFGLAGSAAGTFGAGMSAGFGALMGEAGLAGAVDAGMIAVQAGNIAGGLGTLAGALGPIALGIAAIANLIDSKRGGPKTESGYAGSSGSRNIETRFGDPSAAQSIAGTISASYAALAQQLGLVQRQLDVGVYYAMDPQGSANTLLQVSTPTYDRNARMGGIENVARGEDALKAAIAEETVRAIYSGLQNSDLAQKFKDYLNGLTLNASGSELQARINDVVNAKGLAQLFEPLGGVFASLATQGISAQSAFVQAAGGIEALSAATGGYVDAFLTETEKQDLAMQRLTATFAAAGIQLPQSDAAYRAAVESALAAHTEEGNKTALVLMSNAQAFKALQQSAGTGDLTALVEALRQPADRSLQEQAQNIRALEQQSMELWVQYFEALGDQAEAASRRRELDIAGWNAAEVAQYDFNQSLRESIEQIKATKAAEQARAQELARIAEQRVSLEGRLLELQGDTTALRDRELAALDATLRPLQERIYALEDAAQAERKAAEETRAREDAARSLAQQRSQLETRILQLQGDTAGLRERELAALDASLRPLQERIYALEDAAGAATGGGATGGAAASDLAQRRVALEERILQLQGDTTTLRERELAALDETLRPLQEQIYTLEDQAEAARSTAEAARQAAVAQEQAAQRRATLEGRLLQLQGDTAALRERELAALDESLRPLQQQIYALEDQAQATRDAAEAASRAAAAEDQRAQRRGALEERILQLQGNTAALRERELAALDETLRPLQQQIYALEDQAQAARDAAEAQSRAAALEQQRTNDRERLEGQLLQLQGNTAALRQRELAAMDETLRPLQERIYLLQDEKAAQAEAEAATRQVIAAAQQRAEAVLREREGLQERLLRLEGNTAEIRAMELARLDPGNRALLERIYQLEDEKTAQEEAARAAEQLRQTWRGLSQTLTDEVRRIQGLMIGSGRDGLAAAQAAFTVALAKARAGDTEAASQLPKLSQSYLQLYEQNAGSALDLRRVQGRTAAALEGVAAWMGAGTVAAPIAGSAAAGTQAQVASQIQQAIASGEMQSIGLAAILTRIANRLDEWEADGLPAERDEGATV